MYLKLKLMDVAYRKNVDLSEQLPSCALLQIYASEKRVSLNHLLLNLQAWPKMQIEGDVKAKRKFGLQNMQLRKIPSPR